MKSHPGSQAGSQAARQLWLPGCLPGCLVGSSLHFITFLIIINYIFITGEPQLPGCLAACLAAWVALHYISLLF